MIEVLEGTSLLLVEDSAIIAMDTAEALEGLGATVVGPAGTLTDVLHILDEDGTIDCAILDIHLGDETVFSIVPQIIKRGIPIIFLSGYDKDLVVPARLRDYPCLEKPINLNELIDEIIRVLPNRKNRLALHAAL